MRAKGRADWDIYQNLNTPAAQEDFLRSKNSDYKIAAESAQAWGIGGSNSRALNVVTIAITGALGGQTDLQVAANSLSPYAAQLIGEQWGHGEDKNKAAQLTAHAILGAALAYVNGGNPAAGGSAAVAAESAADYFSQKYNDGKTAINPETGQFDPNLLPENVKSSIRDLTSAIGAVVGGTVGDSAFNAQLAGVVGQNTVENNGLETMDPNAFNETVNDNTGQSSKDALEGAKKAFQTVKDNSSYKIASNGDFIICVKVANFSCAPRAGERYATSKEIAEKGGETLITIAISHGAGKALEPVVVYIGKSGVVSKVTNYFKSAKPKIDQRDIYFLKTNNIKFSDKDLISTIRAPDGKVVFLEKGTEKAGLAHILKGYQKDFENIGVKADDIPKVLMETVSKGKIVGYQGKGRPIYEITLNGEKRVLLSR